MTFDDLTNVALVGTGRGAPKIATDEPALASALAALPAGTAEDRLLDAAAIVSAYETCGTAPATSPTGEPARAAPDERPACSRRAADLLGRILALPNTPNKQQLACDWLAAAARCRQRVPHTLLYPLLEYAAANRPLRDPAAAVVDARGFWLMSLNRRWQFAGGEEENATNVWATGNREQRTSALRRLRASDPAAAAARALVESTWKEDAADERAAFLEVMAAGLSISDEPLLESALDDRSKLVRTAAADVLARLAESGLVARMKTRLEPLLSLKPGAAGGLLLRKAKPAAIEVTLPPDAFHPKWSRDGLIEKPLDRSGRRQWWLAQMLRSVPPSHWSSKWQLTPAECIAAAPADFATLLIDAWAVAAERHRDVSWMTALLLASARGQGPAKIDLINALPPDAQRAIFVDLISAANLEAQGLAQILDAVGFEFDAAITKAVLPLVEQHLSAKGTNYYYAADAILGPLAHRLPVDAYDDLAERWSGAAWEVSRKAFDTFLQTLQFRRDIQAEFALCP